MYVKISSFQGVKFVKQKYNFIYSQLVNMKKKKIFSNYSYLYVYCKIQFIFQYFFLNKYCGEIWINKDVRYLEREVFQLQDFLLIRSKKLFFKFGIVCFKKGVVKGGVFYFRIINFRGCFFRVKVGVFVFDFLVFFSGVTGSRNFYYFQSGIEKFQFCEKFICLYFRVF